MKFEFTIEEVNLIMNSLGRMPYEAVYQLIDNVRQQAGPQLQQTPPPQSPVTAPSELN